MVGVGLARLRHSRAWAADVRARAVRVWHEPRLSPPRSLRKLRALPSSSASTLETSSALDDAPAAVIAIYTSPPRSRRAECVRQGTRRTWQGANSARSTALARVPSGRALFAEGSTPRMRSAHGCAMTLTRLLNAFAVSTGLADPICSHQIGSTFHVLTHVLSLHPSLPSPSPILA